MSATPSGRRVVVTGLGMCTPLGLDTETTWKALLAGQCGIARITRFDPTGFPVTFAAQAENPEPGADLKSALVRRALAEAVGQARFRGGSRTAVCVGSEASRPELGTIARRYRLGELPDPAEFRRAAPWAPSRLVQELTSASGPVSTISTACSSSGQAVGEAAMRIRRGPADSAIAGGVDVLVDPLMVAGFSLLGALSTRNDDPARSSRPFDRQRDGFVLGEGSAFLVLEDEERAAARGAPVLGRVLGYGSSLNAYRITDSPPDGRGAALAMTAALESAGIAPADVDYVNAHGTSTAQNDASEPMALYRVFHRENPGVPISSTKGSTGHLIAACGAVEVGFCLLAMRDSVIPHTLNLREPDPDLGLNHVMGAPLSKEVRISISNSFGFGGSNAVVVLERGP